MDNGNIQPQFRNTKQSISRFRNKKIRRSTEQSLFLPEETIVEILARLPVKSLLKFKCVSKPWRSLISSEWFIKIQLDHSTRSTSLSHHRVILNSSDALKQHSLQPLMLNKPSLDPTDNRPETGYVVGCCNGLICLLKEGRFFLWNPATRIFVELPNIRRHWPTKLRLRTVLYPTRDIGFGWDEASGAYKVVAVEYIGNTRVCKVYNSNTNSWGTVDESDDLGILHGKGAFVGGKLHWLRVPEEGRRGGDDATGIATFDLKSEVFGAMELPTPYHPMRRFGLLLGAVGGFLSFVYSDRKGIGMLVMKQYGVKGSWEKVMAISLDCEPYQTPPFVAPIYIGLNGEVLVLCQSSFLVYKRDENVSSMAVGTERGVDEQNAFVYDQTAFVYVESLVSPVPHKKLSKLKVWPHREYAEFFGAY